MSAQPRSVFCRRRLWPLLLVAVVALAGCGKKGPLYLPEEPPARPAVPGK